VAQRIEAERAALARELIETTRTIALSSMRTTGW
jgi:hypothetical protein